jgi:hypothetical protein
MKELVMREYRVLKKHRSSRWKALLTTSMISLALVFSVIYLLPSEAKAQDDYTFGTEQVNKGYSINPTERNTENAVYNQLQEADQYTDTNFSGSSENVVTGTTGGGAFPSALDTDDATRRNYIEANTASTNYIAALMPTSDSSVNWDTVYPASPTTHYDKLDESTYDSDTTYVTTATSSDRDVFGMADVSTPPGTPTYDIQVWAWAKKASGGSMNLQFGMVAGGTDYSAYSGTLTTGYLNYSAGWTTNPKTVAEWTLSDINALTTYMTTSDIAPVPYVTQLGILVYVNYTTSYQLDAQITYSSVTSTSQTTGFQVFCQGYRNGDTENVKVQAWNYTSSAWVDKVTISAASDTDYNFNLLGWAGNCERSSGNVVLLRLVDASNGDATQTTAYLDVLKVNRIEQGYALDVELTSTTVAQYGNITLRIKAYTSAEQFNVNIYNYTAVGYDLNWMSITSLSNTWQITLNLNDTNHRSGTSVKIQVVDATVYTADTTQDSLYLDVAWVTRYHTDPGATLYGADPSTTNLGNAIAFFLNYTDYDNEAPTTAYPKVHIDSTDYTMTKNDSGDSSYYNGVNYSYSKSDLTAGSHTYYFIVKDDSSSEVTTGSGQVNIHQSPTLSGDSVDPATGNNGDTFSFFVTYNDADGDLPTYMKVHIDSTDYDMDKNDTEDVTPPIAYHYDKQMSGGTHSYYFKTIDVYSSEVQTTPKNLDVNNPPTLSGFGRTPGDPVYANTLLNFTATYTDLDGDLPSAMKWRENGGATQNLSMAEVYYWDTDVTDGKLYYKELYLSHGNHDYDYWATDGMAGVSGGSNSITIQNRAPTIDNKFVDDHEWRNTYWEYDYSYTDLDGDTVVFEMTTNATFLDINSASGLVYGTTSDPVGWYDATVWCNDSYSGSDSDSFILYVDNRAPIITNGPSSHVDQWRNQAWYYNFDYSDADSDSVSWVRSGPSWLTITADGNLTGTTSDTPGLYSFVIYCNDSYGGSANYPFDIHIENRAPDITNGPGASVNEWRNTAWQYDFDYSDADGDSVSWGRSGADWLGINSNGLLSGTTTNTPGDYAITVYCNDSYSGQDTYAFTLHILNRAPTITNGPGADPSEWRNTFWSYDFDFSDADGDSMTWERSGASWLTINGGTGLLSGTTTDTPGSYAFTVYANDSYGGSANYPFTLHINNRAPTITSSGNTTQQLSTYMAYLVTATDDDGDSLNLDMWTNASWLSKSRFWINGTATGVGWYQVNIWVNDSYGGSDSDSWQVTVWTTENQPPSFTSAPKDSVGHPVDYYYDCNATDPESDPLVFAMTSTHPNLGIDTSTGEVTGYIATAGTWWVNISVSDDHSHMVWQNFSLTASNTVPSFTSSPKDSVDHPVDYYYDCNATDADGDSLVFALETSCGYLDINPSTGEVTGNIPIAGAWSLNISVSDFNSTVWQNFSMTASNAPPSFDTTPTESWQHGTNYNYDANAHDDNGDSYSFGLAGNCTDFLSIIPSTGVVSGVVPTVGWWYLNVSVSDSNSTTWQYHILTGLNTAPSFTSSGITEWQNGTEYIYDANADDINSDSLTWYLEGNGTVYFEIDSATGVVNGTILQMGSWYVNISVSDSWSTSWQNFTVVSLNTAPSFTTNPPLTLTIGNPYYYDANTDDINLDTITYELVDGPPVWAFVDENTGEVEGTPVLIGDYEIHLRAFDGLAYTWQNWTLTVSEESTPPVTPPNNPPVNPSNSPMAKFSYLIQKNKIAVSDESKGSIVKWQWSFGDGFGSTGKQVIHQYASPGQYIVKLTVTDNLGSVSTAEVVVTIGAGPDYAFQKGQAGFEIITPVGSFEWNAAVSIMLGIVAAIISFSNKKIPILKPKRLQVIAVILLVLGLGFYVF